MVTDDGGEDDSCSADASSRGHPEQPVTCGKKKMGRPRKLEFSEPRTLGRIEGMASVGCTIEEIASSVECRQKDISQIHGRSPGGAPGEGTCRGRCAGLNLRRAHCLGSQTTNGRVALHLGRIYLEDHREAYLEEKCDACPVDAKNDRRGGRRTRG